MIYIIWGAPRAGKTTVVTGWMLEKLRAGKTVFTNYPIYCRQKRSWSLRWTRDLCYEVIQHAAVAIDEAYMDYGSRSSSGKYGKNLEKGFTLDEHTMFATNGHNDVDFYIIAQNPARIDVIIREMANFFYFVEAIRIPFTDIVLGIRVKGFLTETDMTMRRDDPYNQVTYWRWPWPIKGLIYEAFKAFDTHYYRNRGAMRQDFLTWGQDPLVEDTITTLCNAELARIIQEQEMLTSTSLPICARSP